MYLSNSNPIFIEERTKSERTETVSRLYGMGFNLIPMNGKKPCIEWKPYQSQRATPAEIKEWMLGRFPTKNGKNFWKAEILNFALLTGGIPWSDENPGIVVIDSDDEEAGSHDSHRFRQRFARCRIVPVGQFNAAGTYADLVLRQLPAPSF